MISQDVRTDLTFFTNEPGTTLHDRFLRTLKDVRYFDVLVGYFRSSGFFRLYKALESIEKIRILIGLNLDRLTYEIIEHSKGQAEFDFSTHHEIYDNVEQEIQVEVEKSEDKRQVEEGILKFVEYLQSGKIDLKVHPSRNIHAKVYISRYHEQDRDFGNVITGSSNFSESGFVAQREFNVQLKDSSDVRYALEKFEELWDEGIDVSEKFVETIRTKTYLNDHITPYELFLKFLYEYFKQDLSYDSDLFYKNFPANFMQLEYQEQAVINAKKILEEYGGVFLADVVGLGKTYIAALLANQLPGRNLVIASPSLLNRDNPNSWPNVFHDFKIAADFESVGMLEHILARGTDRYDNVFIDEAHKFRNENNISYEKLAAVCRGKKVILISATPLNNSPRDILSQLKLFQTGKNSTIPGVKNLDHFFNALQKKLDDLDRKENYDEYMQIVRDNAQIIREKVLKYVMVRRTRNEVAKYFSNDLNKQGLNFPEIVSPTPIFYQMDQQLDVIFKETIELLTNPLTFRYARYTPLLYLKEELSEFDQTAQRNMSGFMKGLLVKRLESSFYAFKKSVGRFIESYEKFINAYNKGAVFFSKKHWHKVIDYFLSDDWDAIQKLIDEEKAEQYPSHLFSDDFIKVLQSDLQTLQKIQSMWNTIDYDPKIEKFIAEIQNGKKLKTNKLIIFTESKETAEYLADNLKKSLQENTLLYHGNSDEHQLSKVIANFDAKARSQKDTHRILIATEVLSEGINLHRSNVVINYDIPWNPTRMIQRVGRVNRVDTKFERVYTFNFFPTEQANDLIKLKESAIAKINYFIEMLGNDAKLLTDGEEIKSFELFNKLTSKKFLTGEDEDLESDLKYLSIIKEIRDDHPDLYKKIKQLPPKARSATRRADTQLQSLPTLLTYFRKGKLEKFYVAYDNTSHEVDFLTAANLFQAAPETPRQKVPPNFYELLNQNKSMLINDLTSSEEDSAMVSGSRDNAVRVLKILKSREMRNYPTFTDTDDQYVRDVINLLDEGGLPKITTKQLYKAVKNLTKPPQILSAIKRTLPNEFFNTSVNAKNEWQKHPSQVILSQCFIQ